MNETVLKQIVKPDSRHRVTILRRRDGLFFYRLDWFAEWDDAPAAWQDGYPPSGLFASGEEAEADARQAIDWLRISN